MHNVLEKMIFGWGLEWQSY